MVGEQGQAGFWAWSQLMPLRLPLASPGLQLGEGAGAGQAGDRRALQLSDWGGELQLALRVPL